MQNTTRPIPLSDCPILGTALPFLGSIFDRISFNIEGVLFLASAQSIHFTRNFMREMPAPAFDTANNFWSDMLITQPPCYMVRIVIWMYRKNVYEHDIYLQRAGGIKLGDIYDVFQSRLVGDYNQYFVMLTMGDWVPGERASDTNIVYDCVKCEVHNGEVQCAATPIG